MPILTVQTNVADNQVTDDFLQQLSAKLAQVLNKPEKYVAVNVSAGQKLLFSGTNDPAALMELVSIGLQASQTTNISKEIMGLFEDKLRIKPDRMYLKFTNVSGNMLVFLSVSDLALDNRLLAKQQTTGDSISFSQIIATTAIKITKYESP